MGICFFGAVSRRGQERGCDHPLGAVWKDSAQTGHGPGHRSTTTRTGGSHSREGFIEDGERRLRIVAERLRSRLRPGMWPSPGSISVWPAPGSMKTRTEEQRQEVGRHGGTIETTLEAGDVTIPWEQFGRTAPTGGTGHAIGAQRQGREIAIPGKAS